MPCDSSYHHPNASNNMEINGASMQNTRNQSFQHNLVSAEPQGTSSTGSYAPLDAAFNQSEQMSDFQQRLATHNPLISSRSMGNCQAQGDVQLSAQSEEKINNKVDEMIGSYYNRDNDYAKLGDKNMYDQYRNSEIPNVQEGIQFPLNRSQHYPANQLGSELLEKFDSRYYNGSQQQGGYWEKIKNNVQKCTGMTFFQLVLLVAVIVLLIYGGYWLYKNNSTKTNPSSLTITSVSSPSQNLFRNSMY